MDARSDSLHSPQENYMPSLNLENMHTEAKKNGVAVITLFENGMILNCNEAAGELLNCEPRELTWQPVSRLLPQLAKMPLILDEKINPYLGFLSVAGHRFEVVGMNGSRFASELFFSLVEEFGKCCIRITLKPIRQGQATTLRHLRAY